MAKRTNVPNVRIVVDETLECSGCGDRIEPRQAWNVWQHIRDGVSRFFITHHEPSCNATADGELVTEVRP